MLIYFSPFWKLGARDRGAWLADAVSSRGGERGRSACPPPSSKDTSPVVGPTRATSSNPHAFGGSQNPSRRRPDLEMGPLPGQLAESRRGRAGGGGLIRHGWCPMQRGDLDTAALEEQAK